MSSLLDPHEAGLARSRKGKLVDRLTRKRNLSLFFAFLSLCLSVVFWIVRLPVVAFCAGIISVIFALRYFDANSHRHEVIRRSDSLLVPVLSLLKPEPSAEADVSANAPDSYAEPSHRVESVDELPDDSVTMPSTEATVDVRAESEGR